MTNEATTPVPPPLPQLRDMPLVERLLKDPLGLVALFESRRKLLNILGLLGLIILCAATYGIVVGTFAGGMQLWAAPLKLVLGVVVSALFCLPGLYMAACLADRNVTFMSIASYLLAAVALSSLLLVGFAPAAWLFSVSSSSIFFMGLFHFLIWTMATAAGLRLLNVTLGGDQPLCRGHLLMWCVLFLLVCLQMSTTLRPLLGTSDKLFTNEKRFFLSHWVRCLQGER